MTNRNRKKEILDFLATADKPWRWTSMKSWMQTITLINRDSDEGVRLWREVARVAQEVLEEKR